MVRTIGATTRMFETLASDVSTRQIETLLCQICNRWQPAAKPTGRSARRQFKYPAAGWDVCSARQARGLSLLRLLLRGGGLGLGGLLLVAPDHDYAEEGADDGGGEEDEDDGDADGPDARGEEVLEGVVRVDEGLGGRVSDALLETFRVPRGASVLFTMNKVQKV